MRLAVSIVLLALAGGPATARETPAPGTEGINPVVMWVNQEPVHAVEVSLVMRNIQAQARAQGQPVEDQQLLQMATQRVVEQTLLAQEARRLGLEPDPSRLEEMISDAEARAGGEEELAERLALSGSDPRELETILLEMELARQVIMNEIVPDVEVSDDDVREFFAAHPDLFATGDEGPATFEEAAPQARALARQQQIGQAVREHLDGLLAEAEVRSAEEPAPPGGAGDDAGDEPDGR